MKHFLDVCYVHSSSTLEVKDFETFYIKVHELLSKTLFMNMYHYDAWRAGELIHTARLVIGLQILFTWISSSTILNRAYQNGNASNSTVFTYQYFYLNLTMRLMFCLKCEKRSMVTLALTILTSSQGILIAWSKRAGGYDYSVTTANFMVHANFSLSISLFCLDTGLN